MKKKKENKKEDENKVKEPEVDYSGKEIIFFKSFEEMNEFDAKERAEHSPIENLQSTTELIKRVFSKELKKRYNPKKIYFK